jgi:hypothetical protein
MKNYMTTPITSIEEAKKFICDLYFDGNMYHFDSPAIDIVDVDGNQAFTDEQAEALEERVNEVFKYIKDPFQICLALVENSYEVIT